MARVFAQTDRTVNAAAWASAYLRGEVPDMMPYGLDRLQALGHTVVHREPVRAGLTSEGARMLRAVGHRWDWWGARAVANDGADVNLCWDERSGIPTALASGSDSPPLISGVIWLTDQQLSAPFATLARRGLKRSSAVWALSSAQLPVLQSRFGVRSNRCFRLPFGVDSSFWSADHASEPPRAPTSPVVLGVGNDRDRDHRSLINALAPLCGTSRAQLHLVSSEDIDVPSSIGHRTTHLSHVQLRDAYAAASVVALCLRPNLHVSGMTTVLEAQSVGRPVVCTATPGMSDYVVDGMTGVLVPPGDDEAMAQAVRSLVDDPDRAAEMGRAGRKFVCSQATTTVQAKHLGQIVEFALG